MRKSRFTETQILSILREHDSGSTFVELGRKHGIHPNTVAAWRAKFGDIDASELARSRVIEDKNLRMRRIISNFTLELGAMKQLIEKIAGALAAKESGEGLARVWIELTRSVSYYSLRQIGCAVYAYAFR